MSHLIIISWPWWKKEAPVRQKIFAFFIFLNVKTVKFFKKF